MDPLAVFGPGSAEILLGLLLRKPGIAPQPSPVQSLASYVATWGGGLTSEALAERLGYDPRLFALVDQRRQALPSPAAVRIAEALRRPVAEVLWAAGNRTVTAPAVGLGRRA